MDWLSLGWVFLAGAWLGGVVGFRLGYRHGETVVVAKWIAGRVRRSGEVTR